MTQADSVSHVPPFVRRQERRRTRAEQTKRAPAIRVTTNVTWMAGARMKPVVSVWREAVRYALPAALVPDAGRPAESVGRGEHHPDEVDHSFKHLDAFLSKGLKRSNGYRAGVLRVEQL